MIESTDRISWGKYIGSVLSPFPSKQWLLHSCLRSCIFYVLSAIILVSVIMITHLGVFKRINPLWFVGTFGTTFIGIYPAIFRSFVRIDFFQEQILLCAKVLFFNNYYMIRMKRKNIVPELKTPSLLTLKDIFDPVGRSKPFEISGKEGWEAASLANIYSHVKNKETDPNDSSMEHLTGSYVGTINKEQSRYRLFFFTFVPRFILAFSFSYLVFRSVEWIVVLLTTGALLVLYYELFLIVYQVDVCEGEIMFLGKEEVQGTSRGYIVNVQKIKVQDTHDLFRCRMLKIKEGGSFFPICLSKRHGWSDEGLDEVKEVIARLQTKAEQSSNEL